MFKAKEGANVLAVEVKNVIGSVDLGTLGQSVKSGDYGGSIDRVARTATRFSNSSNEQLKQESELLKSTNEAGNLKNALYTTAKNISNSAQAQFNGVYRAMRDGGTNAVKSLPGLAAGASSVAKTGIRAASTFPGGCESVIPGIFFYMSPPNVRNQRRT